jgi:hypothetical protein
VYKRGISDNDVQWHHAERGRAVTPLFPPRTNCIMDLLHSGTRYAQQSVTHRTVHSNSSSGHVRPRRHPNSPLLQYGTCRSVPCQRIVRCSVSPCDAATAPIDNSSQAPRGTLTLSPDPVKIDAPVEVQTIPQIWSKLASQHGSLTAVHDPHHSPVTKATYR